MQTKQQQILGLIQQMRTQQVSQAQQKLMQMSSSTQFMDCIFNIIRNINLDGWIKTIASSFLNRVICQKLQQLGYKNMFSAISSIMASYQISSTDKRCFQRSIITLIEYIKQPQEVDQWKNFILKHINDNKLFDTGLLLIACTAVAEIDNNYLCIIVDETFQLTLKSISAVSIQNAALLNELIKNWIVVFDKLSTIEDDQVVDQILHKICKSKYLAKIIFAIYELSSPGQIWLCVNPQLYQLNMLKYQTAQLHRRVGDYVLQTRMPINLCHSIQIIIESYNTIKNTIAVAGSNLQILQNYQCQDFITSLIGLLIINIKLGQNSNLEEYNILIHLVCFPLLITREQEHVYFQESPVEFNSLAQDLCDKQTFGILKTQAARLLQAIGDKSQSAIQSAITFCVESIKIKMGYINPNLQNSDVRILQIQSAFQILSILSFSLQKFNTQLQALNVILCDKRMMELPPLDISKIFLFLAYNYGQIFKNPTDGNMWVNYALNYKVHPTSRYMGLDFISNISDEYFTQQFFNQFIQLILTCQQSQSGQIWGIVIKIFQSQTQNISQQLCLNLVNIIFLRIQRQVNLLSSKNKQTTIDIINSLHVLRKIIQEEEYIKQKQSLKLKIFNVLMIFKKTVELGIEDQIVKILIQFLKIDTQGVRQNVYAFLPDILHQFKAEEYYQKSYFILLNEIIVKSKYEQIKPIIKSLLSGLMFHLFDMSENAKKHKMKIAISNILILLQNMLSIHGYQMSGKQDDCFCQIGSMCVRLFPAKQDQKTFSKNLLAKALNLMLICHLYSKTQNTVSYVLQFARNNIFHKYDAYVLIKLLSKAVFSQQNINIIIQYLNLMIDVVNQQENNQKKLQKAKTAKGKIKLRRDEDLNKIVEKITTPFVDFEIKKMGMNYPLKKQVIDCLTKMKSNNIDTYKLIIMNMNEQQKYKLTQILNQTTQIEGKSRVIRKIVGVKTKGQQNQIKKQKNSDVQQNQDQQGNNFKRQRILQKKKETKRRKQQPITYQ